MVDLMSNSNTHDHESRLVRISLIQCGPASRDKNQNVEDALRLIDQAYSFGPDFIVLPELFSTPFWVGMHDTKFFEWAEPIPGPTINRLGAKAREYRVHIVAPIYERSELGEFYNSAALIGRDGKVVECALPSGRRVRSYRKNHVCTIYSGGLLADEKYYFRPGYGYPSFKTDLARIGLLICYDRNFPEPWRVLGLMGAEVVFIPMAMAWREDEVIRFLRTRAVENQYFVVSSSKGGKEVMDIERNFIGSSVVISPRGDVLAQGPSNQGSVVVNCEIDVSEVYKVRSETPLLRDRRPETYSLVSDSYL